MRHCILMFSLLLSFNAFAVSFIPRVSTGISIYDLSISDRPNAINLVSVPKINLHTSLKFLGVGATLVYKKLYLDFYTQTSDTGSFEFNFPALPPTPYTEDFDYSKNDFVYKLGVKFFTDTTTIYLGAKNIQVSSSGDTSDIDFSKDGLFIGFGYSWMFERTGAFSINLAYNFLDGSLKQTFPNSRFSTYNLSYNGDADDSTFTIGLAWNGFVTRNLGYSLGLNHSSSAFDLHDNNAVSVPSVSEKSLDFKISLSYLFDF